MSDLTKFVINNNLLVAQFDFKVNVWGISTKQVRSLPRFM